MADQRDSPATSSPDGLIWTSPDGSEWNRSAQTPAIPPEMLEAYADKRERRRRRPIATLEAIQPAETKAPAGGPGTRSLEAVAPLGDGFIAVGVACCQDAAEPIVVVSADGTDDRRRELRPRRPRHAALPRRLRRPGRHRRRRGRQRDGRRLRRGDPPPGARRHLGGGRGRRRVVRRPRQPAGLRVRGQRGGLRGGRLRRLQRRHRRPGVDLEGRRRPGAGSSPACWAARATSGPAPWPPSPERRLAGRRHRHGPRRRRHRPVARRWTAS